MRKGKPVQEVGVFGSDEFGVAIRKDDAETMKLVNEGCPQAPIPTGRNSGRTSATNDAHAKCTAARPRRFDATQDRLATRRLSPPSCCQASSSGRLAYLERFRGAARSSASADLGSGAQALYGPAQSGFL